MLIRKRTSALVNTENARDNEVKVGKRFVSKDQKAMLELKEALKIKNL